MKLPILDGALSTGKNPRHISCSGLQTCCRCPEAYRRKYIEKEPRVSNGRMAIGRAVHAIIAKRFELLIAENGKEPELESLMSAVADEVAAEYAQPDMDGADLISEGQAAEEAQDYISAHVSEQAHDYVPLAVEEKFYIDLGNGWDFMGVIDLIAGDEAGAGLNVTDFKTARRTPTSWIEHESIQLTGYAAAAMEGTDLKEVEVRLDHLIRKGGKKKTPTMVRDLRVSHRGAPDIAAFIERVRAVISLIESGNFMPAEQGSWQCSASYCEFYSTCKYVNGARRKDAERSYKRGVVFEETAQILEGNL